MLLKTKLIVWDEAPMTHVYAFLAVDRLLQDLTKCKEPFWGKVILLGGDFRQVLPVILRGSRTLTVASSLKKHALWLKFRKLYLTKNMRALESERDFGAWLLDIGEKKSGSTIQLPLQCYPSIQDPIHQLYSDIDFSSVTPQELKVRAILTVNNERSMEINNKVLEFMPGNETVYTAVDMIINEDPQDQLTFSEEFLNSLTPTGLPPYELKLKIDCIIMLLRNLAPSKGLCNGTRLIITKLQQNIIQAKSIDGTETFLIPRIPLIPSKTNMPFKFKQDLPLSNLRNAWFQHDGASPHKVSSVQQYIRGAFQQQVIGYGGCVECPPRSPDLNTLDSFLWGYIKQRVYATPPKTLQELRNRIADACASVSPAMLYTMCSGMCSLVSRCVLLLKDTILSMTDR
ncbi:hypothetical protein AVEN_266074-1 [Araneus ventricosus]|uniref:ATP-dependent DNA helicase n=1 Tax=Araneus ventricosus TaxID=182803 RepID=A0A4Y2PHP5_ARAVE|nr:hypothetical protein AVEN_266074-1 [Araneus ventricosus]